MQPCAVYKGRYIFIILWLPWAKLRPVPGGRTLFMILFIIVPTHQLFFLCMQSKIKSLFFPNVSVLMEHIYCLQYANNEKLCTQTQRSVAQAFIGMAKWLNWTTVWEISARLKCEAWWLRGKGFHAPNAKKHCFKCSVLLYFDSQLLLPP